MPKEKKKAKVARRRKMRVRVPLYKRLATAREEARASEMDVMLECARSQSASFARIAQTMERIANSLEPLTVMASVCTCQPKTRKKVKP